MDKFIKKLLRAWWRNLIYDPKSPPKLIKKRIVAIGGGTGLSNLLRGLRDHCENITAVVTMTDDGASSGRLRKEFNVLPPGDIRKCLLALSREEPLLTKLFSYRFKEKEKNEIGGHSLGNLFLTALADIAGSFEEGVKLASHLLNTQGEVLPVATETVELVAETIDNKTIVGESQIVKSGYLPYKANLKLSRSIKANPWVIKSIMNAEIIIIGPGSLFTSIIPNFLVPEVAKAVRKSPAPKIYILNVSTEKGETEGLSGEEHLTIISSYLQSQPDYCLVSDRLLLNEKEGVLGNIKNINIKRKRLGRTKIIKADVLDEKNPLYHHPEKLAKAIVGFIHKL